MAASLFGERFIGRREPAWHKLGEVFPVEEKISASEAMKRADILFEINKYPQVVKMPDGSELETGSYGVVREPTADDPTPRVLSTVGKEWTPIQARELGRMLDNISDKFPVETAGAIGQGEKIFMTFDASTSKIAGEEHHLYWLLTDHRDGNGKLSIAFTPVRVVCQNTLITGLRNSKVSVNLKHNKSVGADVEFYLDIFRDMARTQEQVVNALNSLTTVSLVEEQINTIVNAAYPSASRPSKLKLSDGVTPDDDSALSWSTILSHRKGPMEEFEKRQARIKRIRESAYERIDVFNQEYPHFAKSPYAVYQAIVETEDYRRGHDASGTALFGSRAEAKVKAFDKALSFVR